MNIEILGAESLGVRGLCCFIKTKEQKILIDPGIALGYTRHKLLPHPFQIAVDERIQKRIIKAWSEATDIVISHFHGDHIPLDDANPYQLDIKRLIGLNQDVNIWTKDPSHFSPTEKKRAEFISSILHTNLRAAEGRKYGPVTFSESVPHGEADNNLERLSSHQFLTGGETNLEKKRGDRVSISERASHRSLTDGVSSLFDTVMMTKINEDKIFVHASDIQLLNDKAVSQILYWKPDIVLAGGPPIYLSKLSKDQIEKAWHNAARLSQIDCLILDHHLMRSYEGIEWLDRLSSETGNTVFCAADFMHKPRMLLEADRQLLYEKMHVPDGWHEAYAEGKAEPTTDYYWNLAKKLYKNYKL